MFHPNQLRTGEPLPIAPTVPAGACLVAGCTCKDARIISFRRAAFIAAMARRTGETADRKSRDDAGGGARQHGARGEILRHLR